MIMNDVDLARMIAIRLGEKLEREGKSTFTIADIREVERDIFEGKKP